MIAAVSSVSPANSGAVSQAQPHTSKQVAKAPEDSVRLSPQALSALGDADHDGDSH